LADALGLGNSFCSIFIGELAAGGCALASWNEVLSEAVSGYDFPWSVSSVNRSS
jgi:hypothetical protein